MKKLKSHLRTWQRLVIQLGKVEIDYFMESISIRRSTGSKNQSFLRVHTFFDDGE